jgi:hypothetical protein
MPSKNPAQRLSDIIENIDAIGAFTTEPRHILAASLEELGGASGRTKLWHLKLLT